MAEQKVIDVESRHLKMVQSIFASNLPFKKVWAFGSRVKFTARPSSDLDCVVFGATNSEIAKAQEAFDESEVPFEVQLLNWESIPEDFKENIKKEYFVVRKESDWGEFKLGNLGFLGRGKSKHRPRNDSSLYGGNYPFVQTGDIKAANLYISESSQTYNEKGLFQSKLWKKGTLCLTIAANIGETAILNIDACFPDSIVGFVADPKKADTKFIKYYIDTIKKQMSNVSQGATQENMSLEKIGLFDLLIPPPKDQQKIAGILSAYDDLIENNNKRIKILEEMAQMLYKEWFIDFKFPNHQNTKFIDSELGKIPENWRAGKVIDCCSKIQNGGTPKRSKPEYWLNASVPWLSSGEVRKNIIIETKGYISELGLKESSAKLLPKYVTIVALYGATAGQVALSTIELSTNQAVSALFPKQHHTYFNYLLLQTISNDLIGKATGAAQQNISKDIVENMKVIIPNTELLGVFENKMNPIFKLWECLSKKNHTLKESRDLLLPRLISGELSVENLEVKI